MLVSLVLYIVRIFNEQSHPSRGGINSLGHSCQHLLTSLTKICVQCYLYVYLLHLLHLLTHHLSGPIPKDILRMSSFCHAGFGPSHWGPGSAPPKRLTTDRQGAQKEAHWSGGPAVHAWVQKDNGSFSIVQLEQLVRLLNRSKFGTVG